MVEFLHFTARAHHFASTRNEEVDRLDGLFEYAAGVVAEVDDEAACPLLLEFDEGAAHLVGGAFDELRQADVSRAIAYEGGEGHAG